MIDNTLAVEFIRATTSGRTSPAILVCEGKNDDDLELFCKLSDKCEQGVVHLAREAVAACLAADLGLPVPKPYLVKITPQFIDAVVDQEMKARLSSSCPVGFGSTKVSAQFSTWPRAGSVTSSMMGTAAGIFLFDAIIQNGDRRASNPNCLVRDEELRIIDHDLCFTHKQLLLWTPPWKTSGMENLKNPENHIFYKPLAGKSVDFSSIKNSWKALSDAHIASYQSAIPPEWSAAAGDVDEALKLIKDARDNIDDCIVEVERVLA